jgi:hypothetical protein
MAPIRPPISPRVLAELARKVHPDRPPDDGEPGHKTFLSKARHWAVILIGGAWIAMLLAAPLLLLPLLFRINYTVQWLISALWLIGASFVAGGLYIIAEWIEQYFYHKQRVYAPLLAGIGILAVTLSLGFLIWQGPNDAIHPLVTLGLTAFVSALFVVWGIYRVVAERETRLIFRVSFLIAMLCFSAGLLITGITLKQEFAGIGPDAYRTMRDVRSILSPLSWGFLLVSQAGRASEQQTWGKRTLVLLIVTVIAIFAVVGLRIWR